MWGVEHVTRLVNSDEEHGVEYKPLLRSFKHSSEGVSKEVDSLNGKHAEHQTQRIFIPPSIQGNKRGSHEYDIFLSFAPGPRLRI